jgi:hypothetical protein
MNSSQYNSLPNEKKHDVNIIKEILRNYETISISDYDFPEFIFNDIDILLLFIGICIKNYNNMKRFKWLGYNGIKPYSLEEINAKITDKLIFTKENVNKMIKFIKSLKPYDNEICFDIIFLILSDKQILEYDVLINLCPQYDGNDIKYLEFKVELINTHVIMKAYINYQTGIIESLVEIIDEDQHIIGNLEEKLKI